MSEHGLLSEVSALAAARTVVSDSQRLGLTWQLKLGTVADSTLSTARLDGDTVAIRVINMTGRLLVAGQRVYVITVPPAGNYVVGYSEVVETLPWSPVWTQSSSNPTLGDGSLSGMYRKQGDLVWVLLKLVIGSTTILGTGDFQFSLPFAPAVVTDQPLTAMVRATAAAAAYPCVTRTRISPTPWAVRTHVPAGGRVTQTVPIAWTTDDSLEFMGVYLSS
jgi:hypothetical protein